MACREQNDGCCDDSFAINFDAESEERSCCNYPTVRIRINHYFNDSDSTLIEDNGRYLLTNQTPGTDSFSIVTSAWFITGLELFDGDSWLGMEEETEISLINDQTATYVKNFTVQERDRYRLTEIGTFSREGTIEKIRFQLGWSEISIDTAQTAISNNTEMSRALELGLVDSMAFGLNAHFLELLKVEDSTFFQYQIKAPISIEYEVESTFLERGFDRRIEFKLSYSELLENFSFDNTVEVNEVLIQNNLNHETLEIDTIY
jgi:hypothetical protein